MVNNYATGIVLDSVAIFGIVKVLFKNSKLSFLEKNDHFIHFIHFYGQSELRLVENQLLKVSQGCRVYIIASERFFEG